MADIPPPPRSDWPIYLSIPNLIGYARIVANSVAFGVAFSNKTLFSTLYFISFVCDELDGRFARMLNQRSTFGAVLDMVTDRISTSILLVILTHCYKFWYGLFIGLLAFDISSHWLQVYSTFLANKINHKDMVDSKSSLLRFYYRQRLFMGYCAIGAEVSYLLLYMFADEKTPLTPLEATITAFKAQSAYGILLVVALPGWAIKQIVNLVQVL